MRQRAVCHRHPRVRRVLVRRLGRALHRPPLRHRRGDEDRQEDRGVDREVVPGADKEAEDKATRASRRRGASRVPRFRGRAIPGARRAYRAACEGVQRRQEGLDRRNGVSGGESRRSHAGARKGAHDRGVGRERAALQGGVEGRSAAGERSRRLGRGEGTRRADEADETQRGDGRAERPRCDKVPLAQGLRRLGKTRCDAAFGLLRRMARRASPLQRTARPHRHRSVLQRRVRRL